MSTPAARKISKVRALTTCAAGADCGVARRSMMRLGIPSLDKRSAAVIPAGPAPTTSTGVSMRVMFELAKSGLIVGDLTGNFLTPFVERLAVAGRAAHLLCSAEDLGVVEVEVQELAERLVDEPRAVHHELERVPFR